MYKNEKTVFVLTNKNTWRRGVRAFVKGTDGNLELRLLMFTTEHLVNSKERKKKGKKIAAQYTTSKKAEIQALLESSSYGINFVQKNDVEAKLKKPTRTIGPSDAKIIALGNLFKSADLDFDPSKPFAVLNQEYQLYVTALAGRAMAVSPARTIPAAIVDVQQSIGDVVALARKTYEEKYGEEVPEIVSEDLAFFDGLSNPDFDPIKYIAEKTDKGEDIAPTPPDGEPTAELKVEEARAKYFKILNKHVPVPKKNNIAWMMEKIAEAEKV